MSDLRQRVAELEAEVGRYREVNTKLAKKQALTDRLDERLRGEKQRLAAWKEEEEAKLAAWREDAEKKLKNRARIIERQAKSMFQRGADRAEVGVERAEGFVRPRRICVVSFRSWEPGVS